MPEASIEIACLDLGDLVDHRLGTADDGRRPFDDGIAGVEAGRDGSDDGPDRDGLRGLAIDRQDDRLGLEVDHLDARVDCLHGDVQGDTVARRRDVLEVDGCAER